MYLYVYVWVTKVEKGSQERRKELVGRGRDTTGEGNKREWSTLTEMKIPR